MDPWGSADAPKEDRSNGEHKVNDPDQTMHLPVTEISGESKGAWPLGAFPPNGTTNPPKQTTSYPQIADAEPPRSGPTVLGAEPSRSGPTVLGAVSRYRGMVIAIALLATVLAVGYSFRSPKVYRAEALITMPQISVQGQSTSSGQYLDSQVLLLQSENVAQLAATIANADLHTNSWTVGDFFGGYSSLEISPPLAADIPGAYGATVIGLSFGAPSAQAAEAGINAVIQAYDQTRSAAIQSQNNAAITGIDNAIADTNHQLAQLPASSSSSSSSSTSSSATSLQQQLLAQRASLFSQRVQVIANEQIDLAQQPVVAIEPAAVANRKWTVDGGIGLIIGILLGGALAFVRAGRRRRTAAPSRDLSHEHGVQSSSAPDYWTAAAASSQMPSPE